MNRSISKTLAAWMLSFALLGSLAACGGGSVSEEPQPAETEPVQQTEVVESPEPEPQPVETEEPTTEECEPLTEEDLVDPDSGGGQVGGGEVLLAEDVIVSLWAAEEYQVDVVGAVTDSAEDGSPILRLYYDYTNLTQETLRAEDVIFLRLEQDEEGVAPGASAGVTGQSMYGNETLLVRPGSTSSCFAEFLYNPDGGEVTVWVMSWSSVTGSFSLDLNDLPGRLREESVNLVADPTWTQGLVDSGTLAGNLAVSLDGAETISDWNALRVFVTVSNLGSTEGSPADLLTAAGFQDGLELQRIYGTGVESDEAFFNALMPGETATCSLVLQLRSGSPVELEIRDVIDGVIGGVFTP